MVAIEKAQEELKDNKYEIDPTIINFIKDICILSYGSPNETQTLIKIKLLIDALEKKKIIPIFNFQLK